MNNKDHQHEDNHVHTDTCGHDHSDEHHHHHHVHGPGCSHHHRQEPYMRDMPKIGRNDPCFCGSGKKAKKCCLGNH